MDVEEKRRAENDEEQITEQRTHLIYCDSFFFSLSSKLKISPLNTLFVSGKIAVFQMLKYGDFAIITYLCDLPYTLGDDVNIDDTWVLFCDFFLILSFAVEIRNLNKRRQLTAVK